MNLIEIITKIQKSKKAQEAWAIEPIEKRIELISQIVNYISENKNVLIELEIENKDFISSYSRDIYNYLISKDLQALLNNKESLSLFRPTGLLTLILPEQYSAYYFCQMIPIALLVGNAVLVKIHNNSSQKLIEFYQSIQTLLGHDCLQIINDVNENDLLMLAEHPSVDGVACFDKINIEQKFFEKIVINRKKSYLQFETKNTAIILDDFDFNKIEDFALLCVENKATYPFTISRAYVSDKIYLQFKEQIQKHFSQFMKIKISDQHTRKQLDEILNDEGNILSGGLSQQTVLNSKASEFASEISYQPLLKEHMPNCSIYHQNQVRVPVLFLTNMKYAHEGIRWANNGFNYFATFIWTEDSEKYKRMREKLLSPYVILNNEVSSYFNNIPNGIKNSFYGNTNYLDFISYKINKV